MSGNLRVGRFVSMSFKEAGDVILSKASIFAEAGEIFAGLKMADRSATTVFKSVGIAVEDIAAARLVYDAVAEGG